VSELALQTPRLTAYQARRRQRLHWPHAAAAALLAAALGAWSISLATIHTGNLGRYGLPPALPALWYAALGALVCGGVAVNWAMRPAGVLIACYVLAVVVVLYATVPAITAVPHYAWVYKHIGVTRSIAAQHGVAFASGDIYHRWPGFFAAAAMLSQVAGIGPLAFAAWAEPLLALIDAVLVAAVARAITRDVRVVGYAALIFTLGNWIGQDYFAPQAAAYALALALLLVAIRSFATGALPGRLTRTLEWLVRRRAPASPLAMPLPWATWVGVAVVLGLDAVIVATHQLTPYVLVAQLGALTLIGVARPRWLVVGMGLLTIGYLLANLGYVAHNYGIFTSLNPASNIKHGNSTPAHVDFLDANAGGLLSLVLIALMLASALRLARRQDGATALTLLALAIAPFGILFAQNYGGEGSLRVFLFSSPWRDILIALGVTTIARPRLRFAAALCTGLLLAYLFIPAFYGAEELNIIPQGEVRASEYFYAHAPAGSVLIPASEDFPTRVGARYTLMRPQSDVPALIGPEPETRAFEHRPLGAEQIPAAVAAIERYSRSGFIVFASTGYEYATVHGLAPPGALLGLERAVASSERFRLWYTTTDARIYELVG
jgi:hypothetical protein